MVFHTRRWMLCWSKMTTLPATVCGFLPSESIQLWYCFALIPCLPICFPVCLLFAGVAGCGVVCSFVYSLWSTWNQHRQVAGPLTIHGANALGGLEEARSYIMWCNSFSQPLYGLNTKHFWDNLSSELCCCIVFCFWAACLTPMVQRLMKRLQLRWDKPPLRRPLGIALGGQRNVAKLIKSCLEIVAWIIQILHFCVEKVSNKSFRSIHFCFFNFHSIAVE